MAAEATRIMVGKEDKKFISPLFNSFSSNYNLMGSSCIDRVPVDNWTYTTDLRGCQVLICRSKKDELAYYHIHPVQIEQQLDICYIDKTLKKEKIVPYEFVIISTGATLFRDDFFNRIKTKYPDSKIQQIHIECSKERHCGVYFNSKNRKLIVAEHLDNNTEKYHKYDITWTSILQSHFFKLKENDEVAEKEEQRWLDLFSDRIIKQCGGGIISDESLVSVLKSNSFSEMCDKAYIIVKEFDAGNIDSKEIKLSMPVLIPLASKKENLETQNKDHETKEEGFKSNCTIC